MVLLVRGLCVAVGCAWALPAGAEDAVYLMSEAGSGQYRVMGEIVDYIGEAIHIRSSEGVQRSYPAERVVRIETTWTAEHTAANQAQAAAQYAQAIEQYRRAVQREMRTWARRKILAEMVWCYRAAGQLETAGDTFLLLLGSDPATRDFDSIPLAWTPTEAVSQSRAEAWLGRDDLPAAKLLAASHLMSTSGRNTALATLNELARSPDPRIAALAQAQIWRAEAHRAPRAESDRWEKLIEQMPATLQGGPYFVLGQALATQGRHDEAALAMLRVPILFPRDRTLAASALVLAGESLERAGQADEARRLYQEVIDTYPASRWQAEAQQRLRQSRQ